MIVSKLLVDVVWLQNRMGCSCVCKEDQATHNILTEIRIQEESDDLMNMYKEKSIL